MSKLQSVYDLHSLTSLPNLKRSIAEGKIPAAEELADILEANSEKPLPSWFTATVVKGLRGELTKNRGQPKESTLSEIRFAIAEWKYPLYLAWLQKRQRSSRSSLFWTSLPWLDGNAPVHPYCPARPQRQGLSRMPTKNGHRP